MELFRIAEEDELCKRCEKAGVSDLELYRPILLARKIANLVIDENGGFDEPFAKRFLDDFALIPGSVFEEIFFLHVKKVLTLFIMERKPKILLKQLSLPLANPFIEQLVKETLLIEDRPFEKRDTALALIFSILAPLRQTVGSCFATAPLIHVQLSNPLFLFEDLFHLMTKGFLKRVVDGEEARVPISTKIGTCNLNRVLGREGHLDPALEGALQKKIPRSENKTISEVIETIVDPEERKRVERRYFAHLQSLLLKSYEFTVASFSDWKVDFYKWNMFASLGLKHEEKGGIGEVIFELIDIEFKKVEEELTPIQKNLEAFENDIRTLDTFLHSASTFDQIDRLKREISMKVQYQRGVEIEYEEMRKKSEALSRLYQGLIDEILRLFPHYFQEVYDPDMINNESPIYEDSPSGFRLLFKHGRYDPSLWTMIYTENEYIEALTTFFQLIQSSLRPLFAFSGGEDILDSVLQALVNRLHENEFMKLALIRMKKLHRSHVQGSNVETPWAYLSGGSIEAVMKGYFGVRKEFTTEVFYPKSPEELLTSLLEFLKDLPYRVTGEFDKDPSKGLLMTNAVHAFTFRPGLEIFNKAWRLPVNTYTYVRDDVIGVFKTYYANRYLTSEEKELLLKVCGKELSLPDVTVHKLCSLLKEIRNEGLKNVFEEVLLTTLLQTDLPRPLAFADTNWSNYLFCFLVSPFTEKLELWLISPRSLKPIRAFRPLFEGMPWTIFKEAGEYSAAASFSRQLPV